MDMNPAVNVTFEEVESCATGRDGSVGFGMDGLLTEMLDPSLSYTPYIRVNEVTCCLIHLHCVFHP